jgi:hypothetical protein
VAKLRVLVGSLILAAAFPAAAQYQPQTRYYGSDFPTRIDRLADRIQRAIQSDRISGSESVALRRDLRALRELYRRFSRDGLTQPERNELQRRLDAAQDRLRYAFRNGDYRGRYGDDYYGADGWEDEDRWDDRDRWRDRDDRWDERPDRRRDRWEDRDDLPERWRDRYRDDDRYRYRYSDGFVLQTDRATGRVVNRVPVGR